VTVRAHLERLLDRNDAPRTAAGPLETLLQSLGESEAPTAVHDVSQAIDVHIADSLAGLEVPEIRVASVLADIGAGAGLPGLVLAAVLPGTRVVLVEAARRKCDFLRATADAMGLGNAEVVWSRAEAWRDGLGACDVVCARALAALTVLCEYAAPLLRPSGVLVAWKGAIDETEAADGLAAASELGLAPDAVRAVAPYSSSERRTLHVLRKIGGTPDRFPRRPGIATKRPLTAKNPR
jgi:16S rRNA (guanine527-N7)-methyltransferase